MRERKRERGGEGEREGMRVGEKEDERYVGGSAGTSRKKLGVGRGGG